MRIVRIGFVCALFFGTPAYATTLNLNDFVLFAGIGPISINSNSNIQTGAVGTNGNISTGTGVTVSDLDAGGNITLNSNSTVRSGSNVIAGGNISTGTGITVNSSSSVVGGGNLSLNSNANLGGAGGGVSVSLGGTLSHGTGYTGPASLTENVAPPAPFAAGSPYQLPTLPASSVPPPTGAINNVNNTTLAVLAGAPLVPGDYAALSLTSNKTLNLETGTYHFTSFSIGTGSTINLDVASGAINIFIDGVLSINSNTHLIPSIAGDASDIYWESNGDVTIGTGTVIYGTIFASGVAVLGQDQTLNSNSVFTGQYLATGGISTGTGTTFNLAVNNRFISTENVIGETPIPAALPLFATGLGMVGLLGWRRKRKARAMTAA